MTKKHQKCQTSPILLETILGSSPLLWWYFILAIVTQFTNWIIILAHKPRRKILFYPFAENRNLVTLHDDVSFGNKYACPIFQELSVFKRKVEKMVHYQGSNRELLYLGTFQENIVCQMSMLTTTLFSTNLLSVLYCLFSVLYCLLSVLYCLLSVDIYWAKKFFIQTCCLSSVVVCSLLEYL